jgi:hypothetical protein
MRAEARDGSTPALVIDQAGRHPQWTTTEVDLFPIEEVFASSALPPPPDVEVIAKGILRRQLPDGHFLLDGAQLCRVKPDRRHPTKHPTLPIGVRVVPVGCGGYDGDLRL